MLAIRAMPGDVAELYQHLDLFPLLEPAGLFLEFFHAAMQRNLVVVQLVRELLELLGAGLLHVAR